jgi:hypothetical protein
MNPRKGSMCNHTENGYHTFKSSKREFYTIKHALELIWLKVLASWIKMAGIQCSDVFVAQTDCFVTERNAGYLYIWYLFD